MLHFHLTDLSRIVTLGVVLTCKGRHHAPPDQLRPSHWVLDECVFWVERLLSHLSTIVSNAKDYLSFYLLLARRVSLHYLCFLTCIASRLQDISDRSVETVDSQPVSDELILSRRPGLAHMMLANYLWFSRGLFRWVWLSSPLQIQVMAMWILPIIHTIFICQLGLLREKNCMGTHSDEIINSCNPRGINKEPCPRKDILYLIWRGKTMTRYHHNPFHFLSFSFIHSSPRCGRT